MYIYVCVYIHIYIYICHIGKSYIHKGRQTVKKIFCLLIHFPSSCDGYS